MKLAERSWGPFPFDRPPTSSGSTVSASLSGQCVFGSASVRLKHQQQRSHAQQRQVLGNRAQRVKPGGRKHHADDRHVSQHQPELQAIRQAPPLPTQHQHAQPQVGGAAGMDEGGRQGPVDAGVAQQCIARWHVPQQGHQSGEDPYEGDAQDEQRLEAGQHGLAGVGPQGGTCPKGLGQRARRSRRKVGRGGGCGAQHLQGVAAQQGVRLQAFGDPGDDAQDRRWDVHEACLAQAHPGTQQ